MCVCVFHLKAQLPTHTTTYRQHFSLFFCFFLFYFFYEQAQNESQSHTFIMIRHKQNINHLQVFFLFLFFVLFHIVLMLVSPFFFCCLSFSIHTHIHFMYHTGRELVVEAGICKHNVKHPSKNLDWQ